MKNFYLFILIYLFAGFLGTASAQNVSNEGTEFWLTFPTHDPSGGSLANMNVFVTGKANSEVTVSCGPYSEKKTIPANTVVAFSIPRDVSYINLSEGNTTLGDRGIHVLVTAGQPNVAVYSHVFASARSAASLILPIGTLGQKYYSMNYTQDDYVSSRNFLALVAVEDNTNLIIHPRLGGAITVNLPKAGDVYEYVAAASEDLTGTIVEVDPITSPCKKFAAFSGSTSITITCASSRDPLFQQLYSINSWGRNYGIVPFIDRRYIIRVLAQEDNTTVNVDGTTINLNKGQYYESSILTDAMMVSADKLISVAQYSLTQACSALDGRTITGDPEMVILNPTEFNINKITVFSSNQEKILVKYINVFMKTNKTSTFKINGLAPSNGAWQPMASNPIYSYIQIEVVDESLTLSADDGFNAIAYGFGDAESYAYSAGTSLATNQFLLLQNRVTNKETAAACLGQAADFKLTSPYKLAKIIWKLEDGTIIYADNNPTSTQATVNGQTLYTYLTPINMTFNTVGEVKLSATATTVQGTGDCFSGELELNFAFDVDPLPKADFMAPSTGCSEQKISFTDQSNSNLATKQISRWVWDFGDPSSGALNTSTEQNPIHAYAKGGKYTITLSTGTDDGCLDVTTKDIIINPKITASFTTKQKTCVGTTIELKENAEIELGGNIVKWNWYLADGTPISNEKNPSYSFNTAGKYTVLLTVESDKGCVSEPFSLDITVTELPKSDFELPDVCVNDEETTFNNLSTDDDGTIEGLSYQWFFDDPAATAAENTSAERNGKHKYTIARDYNVTLTITNASGCVVTSIPKVFTVNAANPVALYEVPNKNSLCSNQSFTVINKSSISFGRITKIELFINGVKQDISPEPQPAYQLKIPESTTDVPIKLLMVAYSGQSCSATYEEPPFTLHASPAVVFDAQQPLCLNGSAVQLQARDLGNLAGKGVFTGDGVSADGIFNPALAGKGDHIITYTFTADNGCYSSAPQTITVYPIPLIDAGNDVYILIGGEKKLPATASGTGLTYKWTPSTGLSRDDILNPIASPDKDMKYTLTIKSSQGCEVVDDIYIHVLNDLYIPNSFSPNGDNVNDTWNIKYLETYPNATVEIINRNGVRVFYSNGYATPFNGNFKNEPLPVGVYYYIVNPRNGRKTLTGSLTIIR